MRIKILGTESLGVRGLCCLIEIKARKIIIDPGIALGWRRYGFLPHPFQIAVGVEIRQKIIEALTEATDVVISHFHGDHVPLPNPNPYQLGVAQVVDSFGKARLWVKGPGGLSPLRKNLRETLPQALFRKFPEVEGKTDGPLSFSLPVPHGQGSEKEGTVMMTRIEEEGQVFVHASDIQLLDEKTIEKILEWKPNIVLASGPPLYLPFLLAEQRKKVKLNALKLAQEVNTLILDHHLLRSEEGMEWLKKLAQSSKNKVVCAADFMGKPRLFLEARRKELYKEMPVPEGWHEKYARGEVGTNHYWDFGKVKYSILEGGKND